jgi:hypothetical protein
MFLLMSEVDMDDAAFICSDVVMTAESEAKDQLHPRPERLSGEMSDTSWGSLSF